MTDQEVIDDVIRRISEGGFSSTVYLVEAVGADMLREIYDYEEGEEDDE